MHIELTEMLLCPEPHRPDVLVLSTGEMMGRMVRSGIVGCPVCRREYPIADGIVNFTGRETRERGDVIEAKPQPPVDPQTLQAVLDLSGPGGFVVLVGAAARHAVGLAGLMGGIHFVGVNPPPDAEELPVLSLLRGPAMIPLKAAMARGVIVGSDALAAPWPAEAHRVLLRGRRLVIESETVTPPEGVTQLAAGQGLFVGEKRL